ncbi:vacuolar protein sorting-associated protein 51 [Biomphalaria glabrata]|uniref:Vacuolar protein sorting-associated protein 51 homolog n=1 Tax=Biomphalaria glabrata TaxID=6526 RepID=A0A9U8ENG2_BIOGL|nr:vacuolar protein sorting-associated protein 51 homolog [Biomphalaria glabrata]KAI8769367.1 putative vacuolar protein sorting-associated protein 51 [Biomphalaria glabrata]KAI8789689.1 vacuolar protein sorting-associated protein 51 [Biomphalaria glabrata]
MIPRRISQPTNDSVVQDERPYRRDLKSFYGLENEDPDAGNPCNIDGAHFQPETYLSKLIQEKSLTDLMDEEQKMVREIRGLDSDMQTLVYENYNKFISATDTIRKMKNDFRKMEDEMDHLASNMSAITDFSASISATLQDRRQQITKLVGVHSLLKKLQFLFELPARLNKCIEMEAYVQAVRYYTKAQRVLHQYEHMPSFQAIHRDCETIIKQLCCKLREKFKQKESTAKQLTECVDLLLQLGEPAESLCQEFLSHARHKLDEDLEELDRQIKLYIGETTPGTEQRPSQAYVTSGMDVLEFVDLGCNGFLSNICLVIASYNDMFLNRPQADESLDTIALRKLVIFVNELMEQYFSFVRKRVQLEKETGDNTILVRALDRFHRRLQAMNKLLPDTDFSRAGTEIVSRGAKDRVAHYLQSLKQHFADCLTDIRQSLAAPRLVGKQDHNARLSDLLGNIQTSVVEQIKSVLINLQAFIASDITFAMKPYFRGPFCSQDVREGLVVAFIKHVCSVCNDFCEVSGDKTMTPPTLLLILSRFCIDLENATISYLLSLAEEQFMVEDKTSVTTMTELFALAKETGQRLLNHYVRFQGLTISQMLRKSVETRDWLNTIEPRNVRAVMKRVVEDITVIDMQVGQLYEEGIRKERSSDSSRRTHALSSAAQQSRRQQWNYAPSVDNSLMSNIQKLFSEKIEIFSAVEFSKVSVLTGIVKISLKTFLECVRLRTFGKYGIQQIQVDTHYLQLYLWRFVSDENLVQVLLDEIVCSAVHRCVDPTMMEPSVIDLICERG